MPFTYHQDGTEEWVDELPTDKGSAELTPEQRESVRAEAERRVVQAGIVAGTRKQIQDAYEAEARHIAKVDKALGRIKYVGPLIDVVDAVLPDILDVSTPGAGMVLGVVTDTYVIAEALNAGVPAGEIAKMIAVVVGEFIAGLIIPIPFLDEIFPTNLVCRAILRKYGEKIKAAHQKKLAP